MDRTILDLLNAPITGFSHTIGLHYDTAPPERDRTRRFAGHRGGSALLIPTAFA